MNAFNIVILEAAWNSTLVIKTKLRGLNFPKEIRNLIAEKHILRRKWHQSGNPHDKILLNRARQQLSKEIKTIKQSSIIKFLTELTQDGSTDYSLWKATKHLKRLIAQVPPIKKTDGRRAPNNLEKANTFAQHLKKDSISLTRHITGFTSNNYLDKIPLVTPREVAEEIRNNLNPKKAPGFDLITGEILKNFKRKALVKLTTIINACNRLNYIPDAWKTAEVIMIPKPGKKLSEMESYRPISLLPIMSKLFEEQALKRPKPIIAEKFLVPKHQFGFRQNHSTIDQVHPITDSIGKTLENKGLFSAVFLDIAQAFDRI
jgi:hypothetical protein